MILIYAERWGGSLKISCHGKISLIQSHAMFGLLSADGCGDVRGQDPVAGGEETAMLKDAYVEAARAERGRASVRG